MPFSTRGSVPQSEKEGKGKGKKKHSQHHVLPAAAWHHSPSAMQRSNDSPSFPFALPLDPRTSSAQTRKKAAPTNPFPSNPPRLIGGKRHRRSPYPVASPSHRRIVGRFSSRSPPSCVKSRAVTGLLPRLKRCTLHLPPPEATA